LLTAAAIVDGAARATRASDREADTERRSDKASGASPEAGTT
jgi:hypothetical protein